MRTLSICLVLLLGWHARLEAAPQPPVAAAKAAPSAAQVDAGRRLFARCASCHEVGPRARNGFGPRLHQLIGRKAGTAAGYAYSPALKASGVVWTERNLVAFIRDSEKVIPGNKMRFFNFMNEKQASDIVAYLRAQDAP